ncbi:hypothetical protein [Roseibium litorale]|uniref:ArsR family transcriptional regulator n=1 Tax=Roseibium litorale TaxID=2803841 RepID=A0ABR9CJB4_9HYPH|nr:hypothetical protein [Roseibium litorale]MBD8890911.1 hypothetical protein [Roseibium litorale]
MSFLSLSDEYRKEADANCRLVILRALADEADLTLNETLIESVLRTFGHTRSRDYIRAQIRKLEELGAVRVVEAGSVLVVQLRQPGLDHVERRAFLEGVGRPGLGG